MEPARTQVVQEGAHQESVASKETEILFLPKGLVRDTSTPVHQRPRNMEPARTQAVQDGAQKNTDGKFHAK